MKKVIILLSVVAFIAGCRQAMKTTENKSNKETIETIATGALAGMHLYGDWYERSSYGIATGEINKRVQHLCSGK